MVDWGSSENEGICSVLFKISFSLVIFLIFLISLDAEIIPLNPEILLKGVRKDEVLI